VDAGAARRQALRPRRADDGYAAFAALTSIQALQAQECRTRAASC